MTSVHKIQCSSWWIKCFFLHTWADISEKNSVHNRRHVGGRLYYAVAV